MRAALLGFLLAACVVPPPQQQQQAAATGQPQQAGAAAGTCDGVCQHYLGCKQVTDPASYQQCLNECGAAGVTPDQMAQYQQTDCAQAISIYENYGQQSQQGQQGQGVAPAGKDCNGCAWDGNECIWVSQSNWGQGPYSGAASSCDPACCGR